MLAGGIPTEFKVDVSGLMLGQAACAPAICRSIRRKMKLVTDPERVLAHVVALQGRRREAGRGGGRGSAAPAEPEVIKKGKKEVEGEEGAEAEAKPKAEKTEKGEKKK